ncbi:MAG TPA: DUF3106 domain-containing protein [Bdellovibrionota bacterium]|jgi:hypothetical protein|nr:DUF3106 domain-containing protein [Bdellovibrionota bacterium]
MSSRARAACVLALALASGGTLSLRADEPAAEAVAAPSTPAPANPDAAKAGEAPKPKHKWENLPPEKKARILKRFKHFRQLTPEERAKRRERVDKFKSLPPEERQRRLDELKRRRAERQGEGSTGGPADPAHPSTGPQDAGLSAGPAAGETH